jgi:hypothetical protein
MKNSFNLTIICKSTYSKWEVGFNVRVHILSGSYDKFIYVKDILWISAFVSWLELISGEINIMFKAKF